MKYTKILLVAIIILVLFEMHLAINKIKPLSKNTISEDLSNKNKQDDVPLPFKGWPGYVDQPGYGEVFYWLFAKDDGSFKKTEDNQNPELTNKNPLMILSNAGPGVSIIDMIFYYGSGPFEFADKHKVIETKYSWTKQCNLLYIDWPLGVGLSTRNKTYLLDRTGIIEAELYFDAVEKILEKFEKLKKSEISIYAESFNGLLSPAVAVQLYNNSKRLDITFNGIILADALIDWFEMFNPKPYERMHKKMISKTYVKKVYKPLQDYCNYGIVKDLPGIYDFCDSARNILRGYKEGNASLNMVDDALECSGCMASFDVVRDFLELPAMRKLLKPKVHLSKLHVINQQAFHYYNDNQFYADNLSTKFWNVLVGQLSKKIKIVLVGGTLDALISDEMEKSYFKKIPDNIWKEKQKFQDMKWSKFKKIGKYKKMGNVSWVIMKNTVHMAAMYNKSKIYKVLEKFFRDPLET